MSVSQDSLTAVTVNVTVGDSRCASLYFVEITQIDSSHSPIVINSSSPSICVTGLALCMNRYSFVGFVKTPRGEEVYHKRYKLTYQVYAGMHVPE